MKRAILPVVVISVFALGFCIGGRGGESKSGSAAGEAAADAETWTCPMHPQVRAQEPGSCPICGMELVPIASDDDAGDELADNQIRLTRRAVTLAKIATVKVRPMVAEARELRLLGRIDYNETRVKTVTSWTAGRIDKLSVATTGQTVKRYQVIARIYSPEIYAAQGDLIASRKHVERVANGTDLARRSADAALESARQRLRLLGVPDSEVARMQKAAKPWRQVSIRTPFAGTVIHRLVDEGNYIKAGTQLYKLADLSHLWVQLDAYETDLAYLHLDGNVTIEVTGLRGKTFKGKIAFIDPVIDPKTRTARIRVEVANPDGELRPGMFAEAAVGSAATSDEMPLMIPDTAPLFTGKRSVVYVELEGGGRPLYEARVVTLGPKTSSMYPVVAGLDLGDRVVVRGAFAIDADLQIRGGASMMTLDDDVDRKHHGPLDGVPAELSAALAPLVSAYLVVQEGLASDDFDAVTKGAVTVQKTTALAAAAVPAALRDSWQPLAAMIDGYASRVSKSKSLEHARHAFAGLSEEFIRLLRLFGNPLDEELSVAFCPMSFDQTGAEWLQRAGPIANSYFGEEMHDCGEARESVAPGDHLVRVQRRAKPAAAGGHQH